MAIRWWASVAAGALIAAVAGAANAQQAPAPAELAPSSAPPADAQGVTSYPASFFAQFRPASVADMVQSLPGFTIVGGDDVRGFGGAAGNILIDGQRPTSKSVSIEQMLMRMPTDNVERIDVIRGGAPGIDMQGQPIIANIVRAAGASSTRTVQLSQKYYPQFNFYGVIPRIEQSYRSGPITFEGFVGGRIDKNTDSGEGELVRRRASGLVFEQGSFDADHGTSSMQTSGAFEYREGGVAYRVNASADRNDQDRQEFAQLTDAAGLRFNEWSRTKTRADKAELGADYERALSDQLTFRLLGLKTFKAGRANGLLMSRAGTQNSLETYTSGETILRSTLAAVVSDRMQIEAGGEGAFNFLDAKSALAVGGAPVLLPSANVRVEEKRAEGFVTVNSQFGSLSVESGLRYETSTISQTGGAVQSKTLSFLKPRIFATYSGGDTTLRLRVERIVGQLNFRDFAATAEVDVGTVNAGNPDLEPERAWLFEAAAEQRFWGGGAVVLTLRHEVVQSVVDLIPIANRFDAPGNIGDGTRSQARVGLTLPLERLLSGAVFRANGAVRWSSVTDPVTGEDRRISAERPLELDFQFVKPLPGLNGIFTLEASASGGAAGSGYFRETAYRISEIRFNQDDPVIKIIFDWNPRPGTNMRFQLENALGKDRVRQRTLFTGPRSANQISYVERRNAHIDPFIMVRLRQRI
jgi:outer membrane receptor protein involved in Fe transport